MNQLFRIAYEDRGSVRGVTFSAASTESAAAFSECWEKMLGIPVLTLKPLGVSKFPAANYSRRHDALNPSEQFQLAISEAA